jgi:[ribosomal protein S5]-alanine N-acetyltransferase
MLQVKGNTTEDALKLPPPPSLSTAFTLSTRRLELRVPWMNDAADVYSSLTPQIARDAGIPLPRNIGDVCAFIQACYERLRTGSDLQLIMRQKQNDGFVGCIGLHELGQKTPPCLGLWITEAAQRRGFASEAITALRDWANTQVPFSVITYKVDRSNGPSRKLVEALGGRLVSDRDTELEYAISLR